MDFLKISSNSELLYSLILAVLYLRLKTSSVIKTIEIASLLKESVDFNNFIKDKAKYILFSSLFSGKFIADLHNCFKILSPFSCISKLPKRLIIFIIKLLYFFKAHSLPLCILLFFSISFNINLFIILFKLSHIIFNIFLSIFWPSFTNEFIILFKLSSNKYL